MKTSLLEKTQYKFGRSPNWCTENKGCTAIIHVHWCPEDSEVKEYDALPWYKKLFRFNPRSYF